MRVGVIFGGRSVEHEISVITGLQVLEALDRSRYEPVPIYIDKEGRWFAGQELSRIEAFRPFRPRRHRPAFIPPDPSVRGLLVRSRWPWSGWKRVPLEVVIPAVHGTFGEDGTLQGLLELADIPYVGSGVLGSALGMDKIVMKDVFRAHGLPVRAYTWFTRRAWESNPERVIEEVEGRLRYPLFVKPANLGSSVGISKARDRKGLRSAIQVATAYDRRILVEESLEGAVEVNCAVMGGERPVASLCEQPLSWEEFLTYRDKYARGKSLKGGGRRIPAPISPELTRRVQQMACQAFRAIEARGIARVDFLLDPREEELFVNEINTIPGAYAFYLWSPMVIDFPRLLDNLIELALEFHRERSRTTYSYPLNIFELADRPEVERPSPSDPATPRTPGDPLKGCLT